MSSPELKATIKNTSSADMSLQRLLADESDFVKLKAMEYLLSTVETIKIDTAEASKLCSAFEINFGAVLKAEYGFGQNADPDEGENVQNRRLVSQLLPADLDEDDKKDLDRLLDRAFSATVTTATKALYPASGTVDVKPSDYEAIKKFCQDQVEALQGAKPEGVNENLLRLSDRLGLSDIEKQLLLFLSVSQEHYRLSSMLEAVASGRSACAVKAAVSLGCVNDKDYATLKAALSDNGKFLTYGLMADHGTDGIPHIDSTLSNQLDVPGLSDDDLLDALVGKTVEAEFGIEDYEHLGEDLNVLMGQIKAAMAAGDKGANFLVYGPPGTGKTELVKTMIETLGAEGYVVGESDEKKKRIDDYDNFNDEMNTMLVDTEEENSARKRMKEHKRAQVLLAGNTNAVTILDEAEDLVMKGGDQDKQSDVENKVKLNRMLEHNPVPTVYIVNDIKKFHESFVQRFDGHMRVEQPPTLVRERMWKWHLAKKNVELDATSLRRLARTYNVAPRQIGKAVTAAARSGEGVSAIEKTLRNCAIATAQSSRAIVSEVVQSPHFNPDLVAFEGEDNPARILDTLIERTKQRQQFSLLLKDPEGAGGLSALTYVAEEAKMQVIETSAAYLCEPPNSPTAPPPEEKIKQYFVAAQDHGALLVVHGLEDMATQAVGHDDAWKGGLVRIFTDCVKRHKLPVVVTTALGKAPGQEEKLPRIITRQFTDHLSLGALSSKQVEKACQHFFAQAANDTLRDNDELVVGDFSRSRGMFDRIDATPDKTAQDQVKREYKYRTSQTTFGFGGITA